MPQQRQGQPDRGSYSHEWLTALQEATECLRRQRPTEQELTSCLKYLKKMHAILQLNQKRLNVPPRTNPPVMADLEEDSSLCTQPKEEHRNPLSNNRFATFQDFEEEEEEDIESLSSNSSVERETQVEKIPVMDSRRLLIRILDAMSAVYAARALAYRKQSPPRWSLGADQYSFCLYNIHRAIELADVQISRWLSNPQHRHVMLPHLMEDANIVEVAINSVTANHDAFLVAAKQQEAWLLRKLQPQWQSRDEIKAKLGDRWYENPKPANQYRKQREVNEQQLKDVQSALVRLDELDINTIQESSMKMMRKLSDSTIQKQRYNGERPAHYNNRVSWEKYPDPTEFGWTFTGSSGVTEFFERDDVKLDWYFTTGTIKTSLCHPKQGRTQMFGAKVDEITYIQILLNPRAHTGQRYQRKR